MKITSLSSYSVWCKTHQHRICIKFSATVLCHCVQKGTACPPVSQIFLSSRRKLHAPIYDATYLKPTARQEPREPPPGWKIRELREPPPSIACCFLVNDIEHCFFEQWLHCFFPTHFADDSRWMLPFATELFENCVGGCSNNMDQVARTDTISLGLPKVSSLKLGSKILLQC